MGLSYQKIAEELKKQGIKVSYYIVNLVCKAIYASKNETEPEVKKGPPKRIVDDEQEENKKIYELREKGFSYRKIVRELELQGIKMSVETVRKRCTQLYKLKGKNKEELQKAESKEEIYLLRTQGLTYEKIVEDLEKKGIKISCYMVKKVCKEMYSSKGESEPVIRREPPKRVIDENEELNKKIYELRESGLSYQKIEKQLEVQGIKICAMTIRKICQELYKIKGKTEPKVKKSGRTKRIIDENEELNKKIYELRKQGLSYRGIVEELELQGIKICAMTIRKICQELYKIKGETEPKLKKGGCSKRIKEQGYKKINEQQLAKSILNLMTTKKATLEQVKIIADYYGVDLEKTMNSLEER